MDRTRKNTRLAPIHPGEILREEFMLPLGISIKRLAPDLHVPVTRVADIVHERHGISSDTALRIGRHFRTTPRCWMNLQAAYDLEVSERESLADIVRYVRPIAPVTLVRPVG